MSGLIKGQWVQFKSMEHALHYLHKHPYYCEGFGTRTDEFNERQAFVNAVKDMPFRIDEVDDEGVSRIFAPFSFPGWDDDAVFYHIYCGHEKSKSPEYDELQYYDIIAIPPTFANKEIRERMQFIQTRLGDLRVEMEQLQHEHQQLGLKLTKALKK